MADLGAVDWRESFQAAHPQLPDWFATDRTNLSGRLQELSQPVLLLWGDADPLSPVAVGERLAALIPRSRLRVIPGGDHDLAQARAATVAPLIDAHLDAAHPLNAPATVPP